MTAAVDDGADEADVRRERHARAVESGPRRTSAHDGEAIGNDGPSVTEPARSGTITGGEDGVAVSNSSVNPAPPLDDIDPCEEERVRTSMGNG